MNDGGGLSLTGKPFTEEGFCISYNLTGTSTNTASLGGTNLSGSLISQTDQAIAKVRVFDFNNPLSVTGDVYFNNLSVSPEPGRALLLLGGLSLLMLRRRK